MDRVDMGSNIGKNVQLIDTVVRAVKDVARKPVWVKLTPTTTNIAKEAEAAFKAGADAISSSNTFTSLPPIDPESLEFECNVEGMVSYGGLGGPAILPLSLAKMAQMTTAFPTRSFSAIGGISDFSQALNYFLLGCGTAQVCTAAMLDHAIGPNVIKGLLSGMQAFLDKHADQGWHSLDDFRGLRRDRIVAHSDIKRPDAKEYFGGKEAPEGYASLIPNP
jgi:dihydroorotate dehydrogenase